MSGKNVSVPELLNLLIANNNKILPFTNFFIKTLQPSQCLNNNTIRSEVNHKKQFMQALQVTCDWLKKAVLNVTLPTIKN